MLYIVNIIRLLSVQCQAESNGLTFITSGKGFRVTLIK